MKVDFKSRFFICLSLTALVIVNTHMFRVWIGLGEEDYLFLHKDIHIEFILSSVIYFYGGFPFLRGMIKELKMFKPRIMTPTAIVISAGYFYSSVVLFTPLYKHGDIFFWEVDVLIVLMLLGWWTVSNRVTTKSKAGQQGTE